MHAPPHKVSAGVFEREMESWFLVIILSLCIPAFLNFLFNSNNHKKLPPGPIPVPFIEKLRWMRTSLGKLESIILKNKLKYGPIITFTINSRPNIFVTSRSIAHRALIHNGAIFSNRPSAIPTDLVLGRDEKMISSASYGPTWRLMRRNLSSGILYPSRVKSYTPIRQRVLGILIRRLLSESGSKSEVSVSVANHFEYAFFCLLTFICLGDNINEKQIEEIKSVMRRVLLTIPRFRILNYLGAIGKIVLRKRWNELYELRREEEEVLMPLIKNRMKLKEEKSGKDEECVMAYADTLLDLHHTEEEGQRKLTDGEMVSLCVEFLEAGTDTTSTALQWTMANLVKYPQIQNKLYEEIVGVVGPPPSPSSSSSIEQMMVAVKEEDLQRMPYLKAVVLESLRRHPPSHFLLPHAVTEEVELEGYVVPKNALLNFMVAEMGRDPKVWEDPMEFKPERFIDGKGKNEGFDITGTKEIKMMPFGVGRRICPGWSIAMLHLEYFVANLVWYFEWRAKEGDEVDLSEKQEFTVVMKHPLHAHLSPRFK